MEFTPLRLPDAAAFLGGRRIRGECPPDNKIPPYPVRKQGKTVEHSNYFDLFSV